MRLRCTSFAALPGAALALLAAAAVLTGCGSHGQAAALGEAAHVTLPATGSATTSGSATFTPFYATRIVPYYKGSPVALTGARTPVVLVQGSCGGPFVAALSDGVPAPAQAPNPPVATAPDPNGGVDVAAASSANLYVEILDHPNDPNAAIVACGHPLSGLRQFFDLFPPSEGSNGVASGTALMEPLAATRLDLKLPAGWYSDTAGWALHTGSCTGARIAYGAIRPNVSPVEGVVFQPLDTQHWWLSVESGANGSTLCGQVTP